ncbi:hypothetical protein [Vitiosangium sp. GDMCC 1.1324]|uniref:hypothetical protein n=1 Tax=Vitiosangium sp. (strain GDMCC 1.1324) TaxID=2138576 RepID=UPI0011B72991|nr:hypothetical protein [Vitiosangium sp. GDMCC 1.1324]
MPGSRLGSDISGFGDGGARPKALDHPELVKMMGPGFHMRTPEQLAAVLGPWRLTEDGIQPVSVWRNPGKPADIPPFMNGDVAMRP